MKLKNVVALAGVGVVMVAGGIGDVLSGGFNLSTRKGLAVPLSDTTAYYQYADEKKLDDVGNFVYYGNRKELKKEGGIGILSIGNASQNGFDMSSSSIKYMSKNDISYGVVINSHAENITDVSKDLSYVKTFLLSNDVSLPVYFCVDDIISNEKLDPIEKKRIVSTFLSGCEINDIHVGIYGSYESMDFLGEGFDSYDRLVFVKNDGEYEDAMFRGGDGRTLITNGYDVVSVDNAMEKIRSEIATTGQNSSLRLLGDATEIIGPGNTIEDIANRYNISVNGLREYNDLKKSDIVEGTRLLAPICASTDNIDIESRLCAVAEPSDTYLKVIDISYAQEDDDINWDTINENFDACLLRCWAVGEDDTYQSKASKCDELGIPQGAYYFCYASPWADTENLEGEIPIDAFLSIVNERIDGILGAISSHNIQWPIYLDLEAWGGNPLERWLPEKYVVPLIDCWCERIEAAGYLPGVYSGGDSFRYLNNQYISEGRNLNNVCELWIAGGDQYRYGEKDSRRFTLDELEIPEFSSSSYGYENVGGRQCSDLVINTGADVTEGKPVDVSFFNKNYSRKVSVDGLDDSVNGPEFKTIKKANTFDNIYVGCKVAQYAGAMTTISIIGYNAALYFDKRRKNGAKLEMLTERDKTSGTGPIELPSNIVNYSSSTPRTCPQRRPSPSSGNRYFDELHAMIDDVTKDMTNGNAKAN